MIRTCDLRIRSPLLYPAELRGHFVVGLEGLEPSHSDIQEPKPCASANFATSPWLGNKDSNPELQDQNLSCCRLHHSPLRVTPLFVCSYTPWYHSAEGEGFEPPLPSLTSLFSRQVHSSTLPSFQSLFSPYHQVKLMTSGIMVS